MHWLIGLNFYIALGAGSLTAASAVLLRTHPGGGGETSPWAVAFVVTCGVLAVYNLGRIAVKRGEGAQPNETDTSRRRWIERQQKAVALLGAMSLLACGLGTLTLLPPSAWIVLASGAAVVGAYYGGAAWATRKNLGLRSVPAIKPLTVGAAWAVATALLPAAAMGESLGTAAAWNLAAVNGLFIAGLTLPFDIRDRRHDADRGVATLATVAGPAAVKCFAVAALLAAGLLAACLFTASSAPPPLKSARLWTAAGVAGIVLLSGPRRRDAFYSVGLDGLVFVWAAATWLDA